MLVHAVIAFAPLAAVSFVLEASAVTVAGIEPDAWCLLMWGSLAGMLVVALPATLTGISERNHMYVNWPPSHRAKLVLSLLLMVMVCGEMAVLAFAPGEHAVLSWLGLAIVFGNCAVVLALSYYGLRITLGRQGFGSTSYVSDMDREPAVDILEVVAKHAAEPPKMIDVQKEGGG
jgi:hypothetical protein